MDYRIIGYFAFGGMLIGALLGMAWAGRGNPIAGLGAGAVAGAFLGWFIGAAVLENRKEKK